MILLNSTIILCIIGGVLLIVGLATKNKIIRNIGIAIFSIIIIFWIGFYTWALVDMADEAKRQFGDETTNNISRSTNVEDITSRFIANESVYKNGIIREIKGNKIKFMDKDNNVYILENQKQIKYINGRTGEQCDFKDLKKDYYIDISYMRTCFIYKNITGQKLKKELLISLSLPDDVDILRTSVDEIKDVKQLGNNEDIVTFVISDLIKAENYPELKYYDSKLEVNF